eukprot:2511556-Pyramimonas_sp.AAC.1
MRRKGAAVQGRAHAEEWGSECRTVGPKSAQQYSVIQCRGAHMSRKSGAAGERRSHSSAVGSPPADNSRCSSPQCQAT